MLYKTDISAKTTHTRNMTQQTYNYIEGILPFIIISGLADPPADNRVLELLTILTPLQPLKRHQDVRLYMASRT